MSTREKLLLLEAIATNPEAEAKFEDFRETLSDPIFAQFFFSRANNDIWIRVAIDDLQSHLNEGMAWVRLEYILRILKNRHFELSSAIIQIRECLTNRLRYMAIRAMVQESPSMAWELRFLLADLLGNNNDIQTYDLGRFLGHLSQAPEATPEELCAYIHKLLSFEIKNQSDDNISGLPEYRQGATSSTSSRVPSWEYRQIYEEGVIPIATRYPRLVAETLGNILDELMRLKFGKDIDGTFTHLDPTFSLHQKPGDDLPFYAEPDDVLIHALTTASQQVFQNATSDTTEHLLLDNFLRSKKWAVFSNLRFYLYKCNLAVSKDLVRDAIFNLSRSPTDPLPQEFSAMVRKACHNYGPDFLDKDRLRLFFDSFIKNLDQRQFIDASPPTLADEMGDAHIERLVLSMLWPFENVLFGKYSEIFDELKGKNPDFKSPFVKLNRSEVRAIEETSPKTHTEIASLSNLEIVDFLNSWIPDPSSQTEWWIIQNIEGLAAAFHKAIISDIERFTSFDGLWKSIKNPIYIRYAIDAAKQEVGRLNPEQIKKWLSVCKYVIHLSAEIEKEEIVHSNAHSRWSEAKGDVLDFVSTCISETSPTSIEIREDIAQILKALCTGFDEALDRKYVEGRRTDPLTEAINATRARSLEALVKFSNWSKRDHSVNHRDLGVLRYILKARFSGYPNLTVPEYAQLGRLYYQIVDVDTDYSSEFTTLLFADQGSSKWRAAFESFVIYTSPSVQSYVVLKKEYMFALSNFHMWTESEQEGREFVNRIGQHVFYIYVWRLEGISPTCSFINLFFLNSKPEHRSILLQFIGQSLERTTNIEPNILQCCVSLFEKRLALGDSVELRGAVFWLGPLHFDAEWQLECARRIFRAIDEPTHLLGIGLKFLLRFLEHYPDKVVAALYALLAGRNRQMFEPLDSKDVFRIVVAGVTSMDESTKKNALEIQEILLRAGRFEFLNIQGQD